MTSMASAARTMLPHRLRLVAPAAAFCAVLAAAVPAALGATSTDPTWPCIQRKVPEISPGQIWSGPPLEQVGNAWQDDDAVAELARELAARRTEIDQAREMIDAFADSAGPDSDARLTALAAGMLSLINNERGSIIAGIERYAARQKQLADKIERQTAELQAMPADGTDAEQSARADLQEIQDWDVRIFQERELSLTYVCELPVLLERRAFTLGREIQSHLSQ